MTIIAACYAEGRSHDTAVDSGDDPAGRDRAGAGRAVVRRLHRRAGELVAPRVHLGQRNAGAIGIEPREGGHCFELGPGGFHCDWGTVLTWDPPNRLVFAWQIAPSRAPEPNPAKASEVEVRFAPEGPLATRVQLEHRGFARHGDDGEAYRHALDSPQGWTMMLDRYATALP
jgi:uncharacterized protein YndB with AHSA1/START domain